MNIMNMHTQATVKGRTPAWGLAAGQTTNHFKNLTCYTIFDKTSDLECEKLYRPGSYVFISLTKGIAYLIVPCFAVSISTRPHIQPSVYSN